ncbi:MAG: S8 family serine peptidase [Ruminococcus sp.]|nr:S8 family serine peptidase [Ruminococcus sp.]MCI5598987.1 S8 family serine peptidase [Ruminococcus sp.]
MKIMRKVIATILVAIFSVSCISCMGAFASENTFENKIDASLMQKLDKVNGDEKLSVSIWLKAVDNKVINNSLKDVITSKIDKFKDTLDVDKFITNDSNYNLNQEKLSEDKTLNMNEYQIFVDTKRKVSSQLNKKNNNSAVKDFLQKYNISDKSVDYVSKYVPNVEMKLSKDEIYDIISDNEVVNVYAVESITFNNDETTNSITTLDVTTDVASSMNSKLYNITGISELKKNYDGKGIKVGNIDWGLPDTSNECFKPALIADRLHMVGDIKMVDSHPTMTVAQMIGKYSTYEGIAPGCDMYCIATGSPNDGHITWKDKVETLLDYGVNVINSSFETYGDERNNYGESAKWLDAIVNTENVLFVQSSANNTPNKDEIISGGMAYNTIVVGNYDMDTNKIFDDSAYNSGEKEYKQYKPDIVAPSHMEIKYAKNLYGIAIGTSGAAPVVSGALALFLQKHNDFINAPTMTKAILLNGATYLGKHNTLNSLDVFNAYDRESGAGVLNIAKSSTNYATRNWWEHTTTENDNDKDKSFYVQRKLGQVHVTLCSAKPNKFGSNELVNANVPIYKVTVYNGDNSWTSIANVDNKCSVVFDPPKKGYYYVKVTPISNCVGCKYDLVYTSLS